MTTTAAELPEQHGALLGQSGAGVCVQPCGVFCGGQNFHTSAHARVLGAAVFRTEQMEGAGLSGGEPKLGVTAGQHILFHPKGRYIKTVDDIFRCHQQAHRSSQWHMQAVYFLLPVRMLHHPHPLFGNHVDGLGIRRRRLQARKQVYAPQEQSEKRQQGYQRPADLKRVSALLALDAVGPTTLTILDAKISHGDEHAHHDYCAECNQRKR